MTAPSGHGSTAGKRKPRLLAVGYWVPATGFARVLERILAPLAGHYDIHLIGIGYKGPEVAPVEGMTIYPCNIRGGDVFGVYQASAFIEQCAPDLVFLLNDLWLLGKYPRALARSGARSKIVCYCPLDGKLVDHRLLPPVASISHLVVYTEFARREFQREATGLTFPAVSVIPHGVDTGAFHPLPGSVERQCEENGRLAAKRRLFPGASDLEGSFVVLNANRAQPRKRIDLTLRGFALFARGKPANVRLVVHHAIASAEEWADIVAQAEAFGIADRLTRSPTGGGHTTDAELNLIYNACDVGINTAMGEGWGLISFEHAATGAAQIVPRHSACAELWTGAAEIVEPVETVVPRFSLLEMQAVSPEGVAAALERLYADRAYRKAMSLAAYHNATQPAYRWERIAVQWRRLFDDLLAIDGPPPSPGKPQQGEGRGDVNIAS